MNLSKTSQYALKILNYMVMHEGDIFTSQTLHNNLKIPFQYLRRLLTKLSNKGIIKGGKGRSGGYIIAKNYNKIFLSDIIRAAGEPEISDICIFGFDNCLLAEKCKIHDRWSKAREEIYNVLSNTSLSDLISKNTKINKLSHKKIKK